METLQAIQAFYASISDTTLAIFTGGWLLLTAVLTMYYGMKIVRKLVDAST